MNVPLWIFVLGITAVVALALIVAGILGWRLLVRYFIRQFYQQTYEPISLSVAPMDGYPETHHLPDVPWIAYSYGVCQSASLQMIAAQRGSERPRGHFDFAMGFTYGAIDLPGYGFSPYGTDPELGLKVAAPYAGLVRRYYVTGDADLYSRALRHFLAHGYPVRVALDYGTLYGAAEFMGHSDVLVGYDASGFYYYETVCIPPATCAPGERPPGEEGLYVSNATLLDAVLAQSRRLLYPWRYALTVFEPGPTATDLTPVWSQNSKAILGGSRYGPKTGVGVIEDMADRIARRDRRIDVGEIEERMKVASLLRADNAAYLRQAFSDDAEMAQAAMLFGRAAEGYHAAQAAIAGGNLDQARVEQIADHLREVAEAERGAGEIFARRAQG